MGSFFAVMGFGDNQYLTGNAFRFNVFNINPATQVQPIVSANSIDPASRMPPSLARTLDFELGGSSRGELRAEMRKNAEAFRGENPQTFAVNLFQQDIQPMPNQYGVTEATQSVQQANSQQDQMTQRFNEIVNACNARLDALMAENTMLRNQINSFGVTQTCCPSKSVEDYRNEGDTNPDSTYQNQKIVCSSGGGSINKCEAISGCSFKAEGC